MPGASSPPANLRPSSTRPCGIQLPEASFSCRKSQSVPRRCEAFTLRVCQLVSPNCGGSYAAKSLIDIEECLLFRRMPFARALGPSSRKLFRCSDLEYFSVWHLGHGCHALGIDPSPLAETNTVIISSRRGYSPQARVYIKLD